MSLGTAVLGGICIVGAIVLTLFADDQQTTITLLLTGGLGALGKSVHGLHRTSQRRRMERDLAIEETAAMRRKIDRDYRSRD